MTDHAQMIADCEAHESELTRHERQALNCYSERISLMPLTQNQARRLKEIWERLRECE